MNIYRELIRREDIQEYYKKGDEILSTLGYTDHSTAHASIVASKAAEVLSWFHYPDHLLGLARAAGYLHDIGNAINRTHHGEYGALLANDILKEMDVSCADRAAIVSAIANHDESTGAAFDPVSAALIIADKTDVRRNRVRKKPVSQFDIHDRVNYAVTRSLTSYKPEKSSIVLTLEIDEEICTMYDYFEIFLERMMMCRRAAELLGVRFRLTANGQKVL